MEIKLMTVAGDDGKEYKAVVFRDNDNAVSDDVQEQIDAAVKDLQEQLNEAETAKNEALAMVETAREEGRVQGESDARAECISKHFVAMFAGDGTGKKEIHVPFDPDIISVYGFDPANLYRANAIASINADKKTFAYIGGASCAYQADTMALKSQTMATKGLADKFIYADGLLTIEGISGTETGNGVFGMGAQYVACAAKYAEKTDKERLDEYITALGTDGGSITLSKERVESVYPNASAGTNESWKALVPGNWEIKLM